MCFCEPDVGPYYVRRELVWALSHRPSRQDKDTSAKEMGAVRTETEVGGEQSARDCVVRGIIHNKGTVLMYSQWIVL